MDLKSRSRSKISDWSVENWSRKNASLRGPTFNLQGRGAGIFVADKLVISTRVGGALKISNFSTCLYRTVLEVNYLFHVESARKYLFQKYSSPLPPEIEWRFLKQSKSTMSIKKQYNSIHSIKKQDRHASISYYKQQNSE